MKAHGAMKEHNLITPITKADYTDSGKRMFESA